METTQTMETTHTRSGKASKTIGWVISILVILFCLFDCFGKLAKTEAVVKGTMQLGYPEHLIIPIGIILLICTILYAIPQTSFPGAILLTGYLGGATATGLRIEAPLFSVLFPVLFGILVWVGLGLRSRQFQSMIFHKPQ